MSGRRLVVLTHGPWVGPRTLVAALDARAGTLPWDAVPLDEGADVPSLDGVAGIVCLGGLMDVDDDDAWLAPERDLLAEAVAAQVPVLGICLGAQQLAVALGGAVEELPSIHADVAPLTRTEAGRDDPVAAGWPDGGPALFHHRDGVSRLPPDATPLLEGPGTTTPAWRDATGTALAVQFHPEVDVPTLAAWSERSGPGAAYDRGELRTRFAAAAPWVRAAGVALVARWLDLEVLPTTQ